MTTQPGEKYIGLSVALVIILLICVKIGLLVWRGSPAAQFRSEMEKEKQEQDEKVEKRRMERMEKRFKKGKGIVGDERGEGEWERLVNGDDDSGKEN